jgi:hypothetical protein
MHLMIIKQRKLKISPVTNAINLVGGSFLISFPITQHIYKNTSLVGVSKSLELIMRFISIFYSCCDCS